MAVVMTPIGQPAIIPVIVPPSGPATIADAIAENAIGGVSSASGDGQAMTAHDLNAQIAADKYVTAKRVAAGPLGGIRRVKLIAPNAL